MNYEHLDLNARGGKDSLTILRMGRCEICGQKLLVGPIVKKEGGTRVNLQACPPCAEGLGVNLDRTTTNQRMLNEIIGLTRNRHF